MADPEPGPERTPLSDEAALRALEDRLARATAAAERLLAEAETGAGTQAGADARSDAAAAEAVPPGGWQRRGDGAPDPPPWEGWIGAPDAELLLGVLAAARQLVPIELQQRLASAARDLLLALRALLDWCLERAQRRTATPVEVQDIPIV